MAVELEEPPRRTRWRLAKQVGAASLGLAVVLGGAWFYRLPLAEAVIKTNLASNGARTDLKLETLDFSGATARAVRIGDPKAPDFWADAIRVDFDWSRVAPRVGAIALRKAGVRARIDEAGLSLGDLGKLGPTKVATSLPEIPDWAITLQDFHLIGATPLGVFDAPITASGRLRQDFKAHAAIAPFDMIGPKGGAEAFEAMFDAATKNGQLNIVFDAASSTVAWRDKPDAPGTEISGARISAQAVLPVDLQSGSVGLAISSDQANLDQKTDIHALNANFRAQLGAFRPGMKPGDYKGTYEIETGPSLISGTRLVRVQAKGPLSGDGGSEKAPLVAIESALVKTADSSIALGPTSVSYRLDENGALNLKGNALLNGPLAGLTFVDARAPLDVAIMWGKALRVTPAACVQIAATSINMPGASFPGARANICPAEGGAFYASDAQGKLSGGFTVDPIAWRGRMDGKEPAAAHLNTQRVVGNIGGTGANLTLDINAAALDFGADYKGERHLRVRAQSVTARLLSGEGWSLRGAMANTYLEDTSLPARVENFNGIWSGAPRRDGQAVFRIESGHGRLFDPNKAPLMHPITATDVTAVMEDGIVTAQGKLGLEEKPARLGVFVVTHDFAKGIGEARATARDLTFSRALQPYDVSEMARGVVDNVSGPVDVDMHFAWTPDTTTSDGRVQIKNIDLASSSLGPVEGLTGDIVFNDLLKMTTPPGQKLSVRSINPGIVVADGKLSIQLKENQNVTIEGAQWPFAEGVLAVEPTTINLAGEETRLSLTLADVDVAALTEALNFKGLSASGKVQGRFPLVFTKTNGRLEHGRLEAAPGGGTISYQGDIGGKAGAGNIAFDALRSFRYDSLSLDLNGDLDGELVTAINFTGVNTQPIDPAKTIVPLKVSGIPFKFNVKVTAPFRSLANSAAGFGDARQYLKNAETQVDAEELPPELAPPPPDSPDAPK